MGSEFLTIGEQLLGLMLFAVGGFLLGFLPGRKERGDRIKGLELAAAQLERRAIEAQRANEDLWERTERAEASVRGL